MPITRWPPLPILYVTPVETMTSPPSCKLCSQSEMVHFLKSVGSNGLLYHAQFAYAHASFSRLGKHYLYVAVGKTRILPELLPNQNVVFNSRSRRSSLSVRVSASTPMASVPLGAGSSACALRGASATGLVTPAIFSQVTLRPHVI